MRAILRPALLALSVALAPVALSPLAGCAISVETQADREALIRNVELGLGAAETAASVAAIYGVLEGDNLEKAQLALAAAREAVAQAKLAEAEGGDTFSYIKAATRLVGEIMALVNAANAEV